MSKLHPDLQAWIGAARVARESRNPSPKMPAVAHRGDNRLSWYRPLNADEPCFVVIASDGDNEIRTTAADLREIVAWAESPGVT